MSPVLAGGFLTTAPPGKSPCTYFKVALTTCLTSLGLGFLICKIRVTPAQLSWEARQETAGRAERGVRGPSPMGLGCEGKKILLSCIGSGCVSEFWS